MTDTGIWYFVIGALLIAMALGNSKLERLPITPAMIYLAVGVLLGPGVLNWLTLNLDGDAALLERVAEVVVLISLFTSGLKMRFPWSNRRWRVAILLATGTMVLTVALIAAVGVTLLQLSLGAAVLLGATLAPTDPVLASAVQVRDPHDPDGLRFSLTGEAGMNDGTAFPFVILGLGLLGAHEFHGPGQWLLVDVLWRSFIGVGIGTLCGRVIGRTVLHLRTQKREAVGLDDFLALGLMAVTYGLAELAHGWGFLAVFFAGVALRATERRLSGDMPVEEVKAAAAGDEKAATDQRAAPAYLAGAVLSFNEQLDRICEFAVVIVAGSLLLSNLSTIALWFGPLLFFVLRPAAVFLTLAGMRLPLPDRALIGWFGIRGIGSFYYLAYALGHGLHGPEATILAGITIPVIALSIIVHGFSVDGLMRARQNLTRVPPRQ